MSVMFRVWNAVIYLSTVGPKSAMRDGDRGNRGIGNREWSGVEQHGAERSGIRIIRIKIKEKCDIITDNIEHEDLEDANANGNNEGECESKEVSNTDSNNEGTLARRTQLNKRTHRVVGEPLFTTLIVHLLMHICSL